VPFIGHHSVAVRRYRQLRDPVQDPAFWHAVGQYAGHHRDEPAPVFPVPIGLRSCWTDVLAAIKKFVQNVMFLAALHLVV